MDRNSFYQTMLPYAQQASNVLNIPISVVLAQWANESNKGQSVLAVNTGNMAGINHVAESIDNGTWQGFANYGGDLNKFLQDYIRVMKLNFYKPVRDAISVDDTVKALGNSPYAESHYTDTQTPSPGEWIMDIIKADNLTKYDTQDIIGNGEVIKNFSIAVPQGATEAAIGIAIVLLGISMLKKVIA